LKRGGTLVVNGITTGGVAETDLLRIFVEQINIRGTIMGTLEEGIEEGAEVLVGGEGHPQGLDAGYFVKPTVFVNVTNDMTIAREEIFSAPCSVSSPTTPRTKRSRSPTTPDMAFTPLSSGPTSAARAVWPRNCGPAGL